MTNNEAAKWIQLYIDLAKIDPTTGEAAYLNDDDKKIIEAMEMAVNILIREVCNADEPTCNKLATNLQPCKQDDLIASAQAEKRTQERTETHSCDCIERQAAIDALEKVAELYPWRVPGDRDSYSQYNEAWQDALNRADSEIEALPSAQPPVLTCDGCRHVGTYDTDFPCSGCIRREKDYYEQER